MRLRNARVRCDMKSPELNFSEMDLATQPQKKQKEEKRADHKLALFLSIHTSTRLTEMEECDI